MSKFINIFAAFALLLMLSSCKKEKAFDASGSFEAVEVIISAEASGVIKQLNIQEGQIINAGDTIGYIDSVQIFLKKKQLLAQLKATGKRMPNITNQTAFYNAQESVSKSRLQNLGKEKKRIENLLKAEAATPKQLDDINAQIDEIQKQLLVINDQKKAQISALQTQTSALGGEMLPVYVQIEQLADQLNKCVIINPVNGTVMTKYTEKEEMTAIGKPLYKIADLSNMSLRAYISGDQLPILKLNQNVKVLTDDGKGGYQTSAGTVTWINDKAEFTPKTIQTKNERANLVYAIKISVKNDGRYKIGMYGEVVF